MKIAHLNTERTFRGGERQVYFLIEGLIKKGVESHLICNRHSKIKEKTEKNLPEIPIYEVEMKGEFYPPAVFFIRSYLKKHNIDILHCHTSHAHTIGYFATIGLKTKLLVSRRVDFSIHRKGIKYLSLIKYNKMCDEIISISKTIKNILINDGVYADRIIPVYSGVIPMQIMNREEYNYIFNEFNISDKAIKIVNVAALEAHKGQEYLIKAYSEVVKIFPETQLIIVGDGKLRNFLRELSKKLGIHEKVIFTGFRNDVPAFINVADVFVMSSLDEGLCTSILDALTLNKVVVATNAGGIPEIIKDGETGFLAEKGNVDSLAEKLIMVIKNLDEYKKKFSKGNEYIMNNFSVERMINGNFEVYKKMLNLNND